VGGGSITVSGDIDGSSPMTSCCRTGSMSFVFLAASHMVVPFLTGCEEEDNMAGLLGVGLAKNFATLFAGVCVPNTG